MIKNLKVGQVVYVKDRNTKGLTACTIEKIGRKWAYLDRNRYRIEFKGGIFKTENSGFGVNYYRVYLSEAEYENEMKRSQLKRDLGRFVDHMNVSNIDAEEFEKIIKNFRTDFYGLKSKP